jgi:very-short-patch-repair endonuclease
LGKSNKKLTIDNFIERSISIHGDKYDYSLVEYKNIDTKVTIICPVHGEFNQAPYSHMKGHGCISCRGDRISKTKKMSYNISNFIDDAISIHGDKYDYSLVEYKDANTNVDIICKEHDHVFSISPGNHIHQSIGCPKCSSIGISRQETELQEWLSQYVDIITNTKSIIPPLELDIVIPSHNIAIEYNGLYWHSEQMGKDKNYHLNKYLQCKDKGYRLIQIWENEWLNQKDIVKSIILSVLGIYERKIFGRKCSIINIDVPSAREFYEQNHIQGFKGGVHHGLVYKDELISAMTINNLNILERFANKTNTLVHGSFSKLLKSFDGIDDLITFSDIRYFTGNVYEKNGFEFQYISKPNYWYFTKDRSVLYSRLMFQKHKLPSKLDTFDPNITEYENMVNNGYHRIWDCGNIKYIYKGGI